MAYILDRSLIFKHCTAVDKIFIAKIADSIENCLKEYTKEYTDFINPSEASKVIEIASKVTDLKYAAYGGGECERRVFCFAPEYEEITYDDFPIDAVKISFNSKFCSPPSHRDFLGSILALGIERSKIGDIFIYDSFAICYVKSEISGYICTNLERVGRTSVKVGIYDKCFDMAAEKTVVKKRAVVSSVRLDSIVSAAFGITRSKAQELIKAERAAVNWVTVSKSSFDINENDIISLKGFGRAKLSEIKGETKKGRISIIVDKYV